ncbi:MAG: hypothetical protein CMB99_12650 [Flavobacteriaceae bacterium]|nr:hypothetical protein [Flavobacteriaceae bacterium]
MVSGSVLDFKRIENENVREISYVTDEYIIYDKSIVANWQGKKLFRINLDQRAGAITNVFQFNNILYILQQSRIRKGRGYLEKSTFSSFDTYSGTRIRSKIFHSAKDIVPIRENEFMILYPFYNAHQAKNFDVNLRRGIGEGLAVAYINDLFETVEFTFLRKNTYKASKKKIGPAWPRWVSGLRPFDVVEHQGAYKMISYKQAFGFRLTDGSYVDYKDAKNQIKVAKHVDPNQFLCHCENKFCEGGYIQQSISTGNKFGTRIVDYYTTSTGNTYRRTTFFKPNRKTYSYKIKCSRCGGKGYKICKDKIKK